MNIQADRVFVMSELYNAGPDEGNLGLPFEAERYFVCAETEDGHRFAHNARFAGAERWEDPEGYSGYQDVRKEAKAKADAFCAEINKALKAGRPLDPTYWRELPPAYGSEAYQEAYNF